MIGNAKVQAYIQREALMRSLWSLRRQRRRAEFVDFADFAEAVQGGEFVEFVEAVQGAESKGEISDSLCQTQRIQTASLYVCGKRGKPIRRYKSDGTSLKPST